jgi:hypothetical protein
VPLLVRVATHTQSLGGKGKRIVKSRKEFFFEKKNQKTFTRLSPASPRQPRNSFCFFFQKEALAFA